mmetsp:Transcript_13831/g.20968  ORF Transcript_13831/g.20968 Transcript_13831/m.20968 type:complete len:224 (+) Transcript_13831:843-1514(+)
MDTSWKGSQHHWPCSKHKTEPSYTHIIHRCVLQVSQVTQTRKHCKTGNERIKRVCKCNHCSVQQCWLVTRTVRSIGSQDTKRDTNGKEDLGHSHRPNISLRLEDRHIPFSNVRLDSISCTFQSEAQNGQGKQHNNGETHRKVCDSTNILDTKCKAAKYNQKTQCRIGYILPNEALRTKSVRQCGHSNNLILKVIICLGGSDSILRPRGTITKRIKKYIDHPSK